MQIDWISALIETPPDLAPGYDSGHYLRIDANGEVLSKKAAPLDLAVEQEASSSRAFRVWTPQPHVLYLSGNPVKLLQPHNLWGSADIPGLYLEAGNFVREQVGMFPSPGTWESCEFSPPRFTRIDVTRSYRFESTAAAQAYIRYVAGAARSRHGAAKLYGSETAMFGEGSRRWSLKIYDKFSEMVYQRKKASRRVSSDRPFAESEAFTDELMDWSQGVVRFEVTLRSPELEDLQHQLVKPPQPWPLYTRSLWDQYYRRIVFNGNAAIMSNKETDLLEGTLNTAQRVCLKLWRTGQDLREVYPRPTFYRHRSELLKCMGVDIATPPPAEPVDVTASVLDPARWDPEPIESRLVEPRQSLKEAYKLI